MRVRSRHIDYVADIVFADIAGYNPAVADLSEIAAESNRLAAVVDNLVEAEIELVGKIAVETCGSF